MPTKKNKDDELERQRREIHAFAAMALGNNSSQPLDDDDDDDGHDEDDSVHATNRSVGAGSPVAANNNNNAATTRSSSSITVDSDISSFAAMANAGYTNPSGGSGGGGGGGYSTGTFDSDGFHKSNNNYQSTSTATTTATSLSGGSGSRLMAPNNNNNNLAAAAFRLAADDDDDDNIQNDSFYKVDDDEPLLKTEPEKDSIGTSDRERAFFAQAANQQVDNSGTFSLLPSSIASNAKGGGGRGGGGHRGGASSSAPLRNSNLEAAAMALSADDSHMRGGGGGGGGTVSGGLGGGDVTTGTGTFLPHPMSVHNLGPSTSFGFAHPTQPTNHTLGGRKIPTNKTPMHVQKVYLPRPLFFGPHLPPRVVDEARRIVAQAMDEQQTIRQRQQQQHEPQKHVPSTAPPSVGDLPPQVRNLVSAIQCYGHGINVLPSSETEDGKDHHQSADNNNNNKGSSFVSVFCPKWSEERKGGGAPGVVTMGDRTTSEETQETTSTAGRSDVDDEDDVGGGTTTAESTQEHPGPSTRVGQSTSSAEEDEDVVVTKPSSGSSTHGTFPLSSHNTSTANERDLFSMYALAGDDLDSGGSGGRRDSLVNPEDRPTLSSFTQTTLSTSPSSLGPSSSSMTEKDKMFAQWVRGESPSNANAGSGTGPVLAGNNSTFNFSDSIIRDTNGGANNAFFDSSGTFNMNAAMSAMSDESDDDSLVGSEMKKKVGMNEHLNKALESLEEDFRHSNEAGGPNNAEEASELAQVPLTSDGGRPLSNQELMNGHAPLFGVDDPPLPSEADLGNHETREEQQRSKEQRRTQTIIEKLCPQNVFGPLACPNPALGPNDNLSWNSMASPLTHHTAEMPFATGNAGPGGNNHPLPDSIGGRATSQSPSLESTPNANGVKAGNQRTHPAVLKLPAGNIDPSLRYGWWNKQNDGDQASNNGVAGVNDKLENDSEEEEEPPIQLPPLRHASSSMHVVTQLEPSPETLRKQNRSLSELHPATPLAQALPFLSDRPPSYRHLQVDTQTVGFPALGGEVEPLFCSLAIYHVEISQSTVDRRLAPIPDLQRCGKVTETLNFDVVSDSEVEKRNLFSLCPFSVENKGKEPPAGTRCGVFPLPSNLNVKNLYVIITVSKVISGNSDFDHYLRRKPAGCKGKTDKTDLAALRTKAETASQHHGKFIMPFAFGVAPIHQVFGADVPHIPSSRMVQIPLFHFSAGKGERQIINHIIVMAYPKANHRASGIGGPAPVTNGGTAMLVMRNYGYLGLHSVVNSKLLARDRLVDFTGEVQLRKRETEENTEDFEGPKNGLSMSNGNLELVSEWEKLYISEPTENGGRPTNREGFDTTTEKKSRSSNYAQELAPLPLLSAPTPRPSGSPLTLPKARGRSNASGDDIEPYFHTTFCNEVVCHPRILHNCRKGNVAIRVEIRELEWHPKYGAFFAHIPSCGPLVHNMRRGGFLVQKAYTSCSAHCSDPHFLDEIKFKLPLVLGTGGQRSFCILFTVYRLSFSGRKKWNIRLPSGKRTGRKVDEIAGDMAGESTEVSTSSKECRVIQLGCGFLPLEKQQSLLGNGNHDVKIGYTARTPLPKALEEEKIGADTLILSEILDGQGDASVSVDEGATEEVKSIKSIDSGHSWTETESATTDSLLSQLSEQTGDSKAYNGKIQPVMLLQVRISVHSSLHSQNTTLSDFFGQEPDTSVPLKAAGSKMVNLLRLGKDEILRQLSSAYMRGPSERRDYETKRLLISTVDIAKSDMCPTSEISGHLLRVCKQLWKIVVAGTGSHDLEYANPAVILPLRVHAFASLLQILGSSTLFLSKRGVTQLDGKARWSFVSLSRTLALQFDEETLFGTEGNEIITEDLLSKLTGKAKNTPKRRTRRHVRSNFEFLNHGTAGGGSESMSAIVGDEIMSPTSLDAANSALEKNSLSKPKTLNSGSRSKSHDSVDSTQSTLPHLPTVERRAVSDSPKVDSLTDFLSAMRAGNDDSEFDDQVYEGGHNGNLVAASWIKAFGGSSGGGSRRWMTAPSPGLATIREDGGDGEEEPEAVSGPGVPEENPEPLDALDSEIVRPKPAPSKQFRRPKVTGKVAPSNSATATDPPEIKLPIGDDGIDFQPTEAISSSRYVLAEN